MEINIEKLAKIGIEGAFGKNKMIRFENLQRFSKRELSREGSFSEYDENITYSITNAKWSGGYVFAEEEKQEIIQTILNYSPSDDEVKETPPKKQMTAEESRELIRCRIFDAEDDAERYYLGVDNSVGLGY